MRFKTTSTRDVGYYGYPPRRGEPTCCSGLWKCPKKQVLRDYVLALAERDIDAMVAVVAEDVVWDIVGRSTTTKDGFARTVDRLLKGTVDTLSIESILTHGKEGCVAGTIGLADGRSIRFCEHYLFSGHSRTAQIKKITSYVI